MKEIKTTISKNYNRLKPRITSLTYSDDNVTQHVFVQINGNYHRNYRVLSSYSCDMNANQTIATALSALDQITTRDYRNYSTFS